VACINYIKFGPARSIGKSKRGRNAKKCLVATRCTSFLAQFIVANRLIYVIVAFTHCLSAGMAAISFTPKRALLDSPLPPKPLFSPSVLLMLATHAPVFSGIVRVYTRHVIYLRFPPLRHLRWRKAWPAGSQHSPKRLKSLCSL